VNPEIMTIPDDSSSRSKSPPFENDTILSFSFPNADVRGAFVKLGNSFVESLNNHDYPPGVHQLLGECLAASALMATHLKQPSRLTMQARGDGPLNLLMAEATLHIPLANREAQDSTRLHQTLRAFARYQQTPDFPLENSPVPLSTLLGRSQLAITLEPEEGQRYQGIVEISASRLEDCLENYFLQSEQLDTILRLATSGDFACGLLLQRLPSAEQIPAASSMDIWEELSILTRSLRSDELTSLPGEAILHRLYHQHNCRVQPHQPVAFSCTCSMQRTGMVLLQIDPREIADMLLEDGEIVMDCEFCSARYRFDQSAIDQLNISQTATRH